MKLVKRDILENSVVEEGGVLVNVGKGDAAQVACKTLIFLARLLCGILADFSPSDLDCQSRLARCKARGESLARSRQSGLQFALGSNKGSGQFQPR